MVSATPKQEVFHLHPSDPSPEEERFKLSLFDPIILVVYCQFTLYFRLDDNAESKQTAASVLKEGLEKTLGQARHLCSTLEYEEEGGFSFVKKPDTTVKYVVKHLDTPDYPSIDDLEKATFSCKSLGDLSAWSLEGMPYGENLPESNPYNSPITSGFQLNLIRGGAVLSSHIHHWAADLMGWSNFTRQLADNCRAIHVSRQTQSPIEWPSWDPACIDVTRFCKSVPKESLVDGPPVAPRHPDNPDEQQTLLFHLPASKAAKLKQLANPADGSSWVSTYDAMCAFVWRCLTRARVPYYKPASLEERAPWFGESVAMRQRFHNPDPPQRMIRNMLAGGFSELFEEPLPTLGEIAALPAGREASLSVPASYIRRLTDSMTQSRVEALLEYISTLKDQQSVSFNLASKPPLSLFITDHRPADIAGCDFGFMKPITHRFLTGGAVSPNLTLVYPAPHSDKAHGSDDAGTIWAISMEKAVIPTLLEDPEWSEYMEYRGVD